MNSRNTIQKKLVLEAVRGLGCHATADEIYRSVAEKHPSISKATVYRNLNVLAEAGEILRLEIPGEADRYDHICKKHYHVICTQCRKIFDVDMEPIAGLEENIKDPHGFTLLGHEILFMGICPTCQESQKSEKDQ